MTFNLYFIAMEVEPSFSSKHNVVIDSVIMLRASNQELCNM